MDSETLDACVAYATDLYARESETHRWIEEEMEARDLPAIQVSPLEGRLLGLLARMADVTRVLEIGTLGGYSGLWILSSLPEEAELVTLEKEEAHAELAREAFRRAGVDDRAEVLVGDAAELLEEMAVGGGRAESTFDMAFVDADKESYPLYLDRLTTLMRPGGLVTADNVFWDGKVVDEAADDAATRAIRQFNRTLAEDDAFEAAVIPIRDGLAVARYRG